MTSKTSFNKLIHSHRKIQNWFFLLTAIACLFGQLGTAMTVVDQYRGQLNFNPAEAALLGQSFPGIINGCYYFLFSVVLLVLGFVSAISSFSYLTDTAQVDFYHSLPQTRTQQFGIHYLGGFLPFFIPYSISSALTVLIGAATGMVRDSSLFYQCLISYLSGIALFLILYNITILGIELTGKTVTAFLSSFVFLVYARILFSLYTSLAGAFYDTFYFGGVVMGPIRACFSPVDWIASAIYYGNPDMTDAMHMSLVKIYVLQIILTVILVFLHKHRRSEAAGAALAYPGTASPIKVLLAVPLALMLSIFGGSLFFYEGRNWILILGVISAVVLCAFIEFVYHPDLKSLLDRRVASLIAIVLTFGILLVFRLDLMGYDAWVPESDSVQTIGMENYDLSYFLHYDLPGALSEAKEASMLNDPDYQYTNIEPLLLLAQQGPQYTEIYAAGDETDEDLVPISLHYHMTNGSDKYRSYFVPKKLLISTLDELCKDKEAKEQIFPLNHLEGTFISSVQLVDMTKDSTVLSIPTQDILDAYRADLMEDTFESLQNTYPIGELCLMMDIPEEDKDMYGPGVTEIQAGSLFLYPHYTHTLGLLKSKDYIPVQELDPDSVVSINYNPTIIFDDENNAIDIAKDGISAVNSDGSRTITDPDEIKEMLSRTVYSTESLLGRNEIYDTIDISFSAHRQCSYDLIR